VARPSEKEIAVALLERHGRTFAQELGIAVEKNTPSPLFRLLCASLLFSTRISARIAVEAARALSDKGWTTPQKMASSSWEERARTLNEAGYARYDERTATMLGETAEMLLDRYRGDLRKLREEAGRDPGEERRLLKEFKGIGDVGADIYFRETQVAWDELFPFADRRALQGAKDLGLPDDPSSLARLVGDRDYPRFVAALVRVRLEGDRDEVLEEAER
jgi:endonuclease III